jgi:hypothetical protein
MHVVWLARCGRHAGPPSVRRTRFAAGGIRPVQPSSQPDASSIHGPGFCLANLARCLLCVVPNGGITGATNCAGLDGLRRHQPPAQVNALRGASPSTLAKILDEKSPAAVLVGYEGGWLIDLDGMLVAYAVSRNYREISLPAGNMRLFLNPAPSLGCS